MGDPMVPLDMVVLKPALFQIHFYLNDYDKIMLNRRAASRNTTCRVSTDFQTNVSLMSVWKTGNCRNFITLWFGIVLPHPAIEIRRSDPDLPAAAGLELEMLWCSAAGDLPPVCSIIHQLDRRVA